MTRGGPATLLTPEGRSPARAEQEARLPWTAPALAATGVALVAVVLAALTVGGGGPEGGHPLAGPGALVEGLAPIAALAARIAAVGTVGTLVFAAVLLPGTPEARRALGAASSWALAWAGTTALGAVLTVSLLVGRSPASLPWSSLQVYLLDTGAGRATLVVLALAAVLVPAARRCRTPAGARLLLAVAAAALLAPVVLSGHSSAADDHLAAVTTLGVHVLAAAVWVGGLLALLVHGRGSGTAASAASRFSGVALVCFLATAVTGVLAAWFVLGGTEALLAAAGTGYGWLLVGKTAGLVALGVLGWQHRRRTLPRLRAGDRRSFRRFATGEVLVMLATVALAVGLAGSPPPAGAAPVPGTAAQEPAAPAGAAGDPMAGHDHGELSVGVLVDEERFHVAAPVAAGSRVTVFNGTGQDVTLTAEDGAFDVAVPGGSLLTFQAPAQPGEYRFASSHDAGFTDVLVVQ
ncbi:copper resistance D family protein [Blastococcus saxobsidens]|uniref:Putative copper resistance protein D n=1 Tax=Blastococcus saxobsidens TaxID=138336 RepID=A0A4Q7Y6I8_9ACTN|nr:CopD family protein [Blastococcus saxobsidens]RZU31721.1 putative copper resistance protein D [Blastococcus saxobsidens]